MSFSSLIFHDAVLAPILPKLVTWRRDFHRCPESSWTEFRTASLILSRLREWGYRIQMGKDACAAGRRTGVPGSAEMELARRRALERGADPDLMEAMGEGFTGLWADLDCGPGPTVAFRFDMDCNLVTESADPAHRPQREGFASLWPGRMHACGHDGHVAVGLGLAEALAGLRAGLRGRVRLIFQPGEEGAHGAAPMAEAGAVDGVDDLIGMHIGFHAGDMDTLVCGTTDFLATTKLDAFFSGVAAHAGAAPEEGRDALLAACAATLNLHAISRHSQGATRIAVGRMEGGESRNVIPSSAVLSMETRGATTALDAYMLEEATRILRASAEMWGCSCRWEIVGGAPSGDSSPDLARVVDEVAGETGLWSRRILMAPFGAAEDFACFMDKVREAGGRASYVQIGTRRAAGHHSERFDFDEACLGRALTLLVRLALRLTGPARRG